MDVTMKLDFDDCDEDDNDIYSSFKNNHISDSSPTIKTRIRALKLFDSPVTPKTLLEKCAADSSTPPAPSSTGLRSRLFSRRLAAEKSANKNTPSSNVNPFTRTSLLHSRKRRRSRRDVGDTPSNLSDSLASESSTDLSMDADSSWDEDVEDGCQPTKRLTLHEANVSRYYQEFIEISLIGEGEFGSVYKCRHRLDGCTYAVKKSLKPIAGSSTERIALNEVYAHAVLGKHRHVVRYYSAWAEDDHMIIQNEYCNRGSLAEEIEEHRKSSKKFNSLKLKQILLDIAKGLQYIHSQQLVHLDIKPANIFVSEEDRGFQQSEDSADDGFDEEQEYFEDNLIYKIGDLGHVATVISPQVEEGDCRYLPREILQQDCDHLPKADIFALGLTIYEAASGTPLPKNGRTWHSLRDGGLQDIPYLGPEFMTLLRLMTHPDPLERPNAQQLVQQLASLCRPSNKCPAALQMELNAVKLKNEILSRQLLEAAKCLQNISPNVMSSTVTAAVVSGVLAGVNSPKRSLSKMYGARSGPTTRNSRLIGKKVNRSVSTTNF